MTSKVIDLCPTHGTPARKEYGFGALRPQPHITVYSGCRCALFEAELPGGHESKLCADYAEAEGKARFALAIWAA